MSVLFKLSVSTLLLIFLRTSSFVSSQESSSSYFFYQQPEYPRDCKEVRDSCNTQVSNGVFLIKPDGYHQPFEVFCDNEVDSGGWTVIQRRHDGSVFFQRDWLEYKLGFGFLSQEFWLGNEKLSFLTNQDMYELRIDFTYADTSSYYALYSLFRVSDEFSGYKLTHIGMFSGSADFTTCPTNKQYQTCTCEKSCENPDACLTTCTESETCICPDGFYLKGKECVQQEDCGCFIGGNLIAEGEFHVPSDCSRRCNCSVGQLLCDDNYQCSSNAVCEERNNLQQCYCNPGFTGDGVTCVANTSTPSDCLEVFNNGNSDSGVYNIKPTAWSGSPFEVYCNMTDAGGWTVFQRRVNGSVDFDLFWDDYKNGFGSPDHELWLGNEKIFSLTNQRRYQLRIDFVNVNGDPYYAKYDYFRINNEANNYRLTVETYSGDAGDSLTTLHNNEDFSTQDRDNDDNSAYNFAANFGAWWYGVGLGGAFSALNNDYDSGGGIPWGTLPGSNANIKFTEMKVRPI